MAKTSGSIWIHGNSLHYTDAYGREWQYDGSPAFMANGRPGSFWIQDQALCYINEAGNQCFYLDGPIVSTPAGAKQGSVWIDHIFLHWIDAFGRDQYGHQDIAHTDGGGGATHVDVPHQDQNHGDVHWDNIHGDQHSDNPHYDVAHNDFHSDLPPHYEHGDQPHDDRSGSHSDSPASSTHLDCYYPFEGNPRPNFHQDHTDGGGGASAHCDFHDDFGHGDVPEDNWHFDRAHVDVHNDTSHGDTSHTDTHTDGEHDDNHYDQPTLATPHQDHTDVAHDDSPHYDRPTYIGP